jgi:hypothetical protein
MFYKSPGRALQDLRGINTGTIMEKKWSIMNEMGPNFNTLLEFVSFVFDLKIVI